MLVTEMSTLTHHPIWFSHQPSETYCSYPFFPDKEVEVEG